MAITATAYGSFILGLGQAAFNVTTDSLKVLLATSGYLPNVDTDTNISTVTTNEVADGNYTAGGQAITVTGWTYDATNKRTVLAGNPVLWAAATFTGAHYAVIYRTSDGRLLGYIDFGEDKSPAGEDLQLSFSTGILRLRLAG